MDSPSTSQALALPTNNDKFPSDVLKWMKKNAKPRMALKLMQVCKYFKHRKFPYFVVKGFSNFVGTWSYWTYFVEAICSIDSLDIFPDRSLWITDYLFLYFEGNLIADILPKIAEFEAGDLLFDSQILTLQEFNVLTASGRVHKICIMKTTIMDGEKPASFEIILECMPNVEQIVFEIDVPPIASSNAVENVIVPKLKNLRITSVTEADFDFGVFSIFMKSHPFVDFCISFNAAVPLSTEYFQQLEKYTYNIIMNNSIDLPPSVITYPGQTTEDALFNLYGRYREQIRRRLIEKRKAILCPYQTL